MKNISIIIILLSSLLNACKKDTYPGKDPYAGARPPLNVKLKTVTSIDQVSAGSVFHLQGNGFSEYTDSGMVIKFNGTPGSIIKVTDTAIDVNIPSLASSGLITLTINGQVYPGPLLRIKGPVYIDTKFENIPGASGNIYCIEPLSGGRLLLGGDFDDYGNSGELDGYHGLVSINADGTLDKTFKVGKGLSGTASAFAVQADGKIIIGGNFMDYNDRYKENPVFIKNLVRINADGSLDTAAKTTIAGNTVIVPSINAFFDGGISKIIQSPIDGKVTVFGNFKFFMRKDFTASTADGLRDTVLVDSIRMEGIVRLNEDGSFDSTFNYLEANRRSEAGLNGQLAEALLLNDGKILLAGNFTRYHGQSANGIVVIDEKGDIDKSFNIGTGPNERVTSATLLPNKQILIAGLFTSINGKEARKVALLNQNGTVSNSFSVGSGASAGPDAKIDQMLVLKNNKILLTGSFDFFSGIRRKGTVVLEPNGNISDTFNNLGALISENRQFVGGVIQLINIPNINGVIMAGSFTNLDLTPVGHIVQLRY